MFFSPFFYSTVRSPFNYEQSFLVESGERVLYARRMRTKRKCNLILYIYFVYIPPPHASERESLFISNAFTISIRRCSVKKKKKLPTQVWIILLHLRALYTYKFVNGGSARGWFSSPSRQSWIKRVGEREQKTMCVSREMLNSQLNVHLRHTHTHVREIATVYKRSCTSEREEDLQTFLLSQFFLNEWCAFYNFAGIDIYSMF